MRRIGSTVDLLNDELLRRIRSSSALGSEPAASLRFFRRACERAFASDGPWWWGRGQGEQTISCDGYRVRTRQLSLLCCSDFIVMFFIVLFRLYCVVLYCVVPRMSFFILVVGAGAGISAPSPHHPHSLSRPAPGLIPPDPISPPPLHGWGAQCSPLLFRLDRCSIPMAAPPPTRGGQGAWRVVVTVVGICIKVKGIAVSTRQDARPY